MDLQFLFIQLLLQLSGVFSRSVPDQKSSLYPSSNKNQADFFNQNDYANELQKTILKSNENIFRPKRQSYQSPNNNYERFYLCLFTLFTNPSCRESGQTQISTTGFNRYGSNNKASYFPSFTTTKKPAISASNLYPWSNYPSYDFIQSPYPGMFQNPFSPFPVLAMPSNNQMKTTVKTPTKGTTEKSMTTEKTTEGTMTSTEQSNISKMTTSSKPTGTSPEAIKESSHAKRLEEYEKTLGILKLEIRQFREMMEKCKKQKGELETDNGNLKRQLSNIQISLKAKENEIAKITEDKILTQGRVSQLEKTNEYLQMKNGELQHKISDFRNQINSLKDSQAKQNEEVNDLQNTYEKFNETKTALELEVKRHMRNIDNLITENRLLRQQIYTLQLLIQNRNGDAPRDDLDQFSIIPITSEQIFEKEIPSDMKDSPNIQLVKFDSEGKGNKTSNINILKIPIDFPKYNNGNQASNNYNVEPSIPGTLKSPGSNPSQNPFIWDFPMFPSAFDSDKLRSDMGIKEDEPFIYILGLKDDSDRHSNSTTEVEATTAEYEENATTNENIGEENVTSVVPQQ